MGDLPPLSCLVLVDKPAGPTSFDIVRKARQGIREKVGHAGTLDPFATGLLLVLIGQATKISQLLMDLPKEYEATVQFGAISTTADSTGEIQPTGIKTSQEEVQKALGGLTGKIKQRVPMTSAVKVGGETLYRKAHRGEVISTPEREVIVHELTLLDFNPSTQVARLRAVTGRGTYIRTLAEKLGEVTGAGAYAAELRRVRVGNFVVEEALDPAGLSPERYRTGGPGIFPLEKALSFLPVYEVGEKEARLIANGQRVTADLAGRFRVLGPQGLLGVYEGNEGVGRPLVIFPRT